MRIRSLLGLIFLATIASCTAPVILMQYKSQTFVASLRNRIEAGETRIPVSEIYSADWDTVVLLDEYERRVAVVGSCYPYSANKPSRLKTITSGTVGMAKWGIGFIRNETEVAYFEISESEVARFHIPSGCYRRDEAIFIVHHSSNGPQISLSDK